MIGMTGMLTTAKIRLAVYVDIRQEAAMGLSKELKHSQGSEVEEFISIYWRETPGLGIEAKEHPSLAHAGASCRALKKENGLTIIHLKFISSTLICRDSCLESVESSFAGCTSYSGHGSSVSQTQDNPFKGFAPDRFDESCLF